MVNNARAKMERKIGAGSAEADLCCGNCYCMYSSPPALKRAGNEALRLADRELDGSRVAGALKMLEDALSTENVDKDELSRLWFAQGRGRLPALELGSKEDSLLKYKPAEEEEC